ncbi:MAG: catalase HPII, partial [Ilumatobacteraceae bacterium]
VLYDAIVLLLSAEGAETLAAQPAAKDFVADAHAHCKFVAYTAESQPLLEAAGVAAELDDGYVEVGGKQDLSTFIEQCRTVRYWDRERSRAGLAVPTG